ncbi:unnamed protein product [Porites evermanni]|uniref:Reverse transcriptase domain-containing protein n=1 Tax=Porites evermanni TaxID=104178 RepID=A0ABN8LE84_9CNID|nr:unnamed protein product [Porites evermanni]
MRKALKGHDSPAGFTVEPTKSRQYPLITKSDLDFADDIALILNHIDEAQCRLQSVVNAATNLRLHLNAVKTQAIIYNRDPTSPHKRFYIARSGRVAGHCVGHKEEEASHLLREEDLGPSTYTLCLRTPGLPLLENSECQC